MSEVERGEKITIILTKEQLAIIEMGIQELPYRLVAPLIQEINLQLVPKEVKIEK